MKRLTPESRQSMLRATRHLLSAIEHLTLYQSSVRSSATSFESAKFDERLASIDCIQRDLSDELKAMPELFGGGLPCP